MTSTASRVRIIDDDCSEIRAVLDGKEIRGWIYHDGTERRAKMLAAREFQEGWYAAETFALCDEFKRCLGAMSFARAGWDYYAMPAGQKAAEARSAHRAKDRAREIWQQNPHLHDELRAAFKEAQPLATMDEIERGEVSA